MCWFVLVILCFIYNVFVISLRGIFSYQILSNVIYWFICDYISDLVYLLDIFVFKLRLIFLNSGLLEVCSYFVKFNLMFVVYSLDWKIFKMFYVFFLQRDMKLIKKNYMKKKMFKVCYIIYFDLLYDNCCIQNNVRSIFESLQLFFFYDFSLMFFY